MDLPLGRCCSRASTNSDEPVRGISASVSTWLGNREHLGSGFGPQFVWECGRQGRDLRSGDHNGSIASLWPRQANSDPSPAVEISTPIWSAWGTSQQTRKRRALRRVDKPAGLPRAKTLDVRPVSWMEIAGRIELRGLGKHHPIGSGPA